LADILAVIRGTNMKNIISVIPVIAIIIVTTPSSLGVPAKQNSDGIIPQRPMPVVGSPKWTAHLRTPANDSVIRKLLMKAQFIPRDATPDQIRAAVTEFKRLWRKRQPAVPNPEKLRALLERERDASKLGKSPKDLKTVPPASFRTLVVPVEFAGTDSFTANLPDGSGGCVDTTIETTGPLHNEIPAPGPRDNFTVWYDDATPALYDELYFGLGPDAGVIINHPNLGVVDCTGWTVANYYHEQSQGTYVPEGYVYPRWLQSAHSEAWYGAPNCMWGSEDRRRAPFVRDTVDLINADDPAFPWQEYDGDGDGKVDNFTIIHAGMGQEAGGGPQEDFAIWSHAGMIDWPDGYLACSAGSPGCPDRDIHVYDYSVDPENFDVGVGAEEFGHAALGLPDLYTWDSGNSVAHWAIMSKGTWNGPLGGMQPAPFPGWFRYTLGWWSPAEIPYDTGPVEFTVGQFSQPPPGYEEGVKINLPDRVVTLESPLGSGRSWWSGAGDMLNNALILPLHLEGAEAPITLSFRSLWETEDVYDYGTVAVSLDQGLTWIPLSDMDGRFKEIGPVGGYSGPGLTGRGEGALRFDLSDFAGKRVLLRLRYVTDINETGKGWWGDDFLLTDSHGTLMAQDLEGETVAWEPDGWGIVPRTESYARYYLVEWRNHSGYDQGLQYAYQTVYSGTNEWEVDFAPYTLPGALVWYRDSYYSFDSYLYDDDFEDPPSAGPKYGLLLVDSHPFPYAWDGIQYWHGQDVILISGVQAADAAFTLADTDAFTLQRGFDDTFQWTDPPPETKTFGPREAVDTFNDSVGYYPGFWWDDVNLTTRYWDADSSAVIPAAARYSTRITRLDNTPCYEQYGSDLGYTRLGSGNPGIDGTRYGVHMQVMEQAPGGEWGRLRFWNDRSSPAGGLLGADFAVGGLWFFDGTDWSVYLNISPDIMAVWDNLLLVGFESYGLYLTDRYNWLYLSAVSPDAMHRWGDRIVLGYESYGLYAYDASGWEYLAPIAPNAMAVWEGLLVLGFETYGLFSYDGREWAYYAPISPVDMVIWEDRIVMNFADYGVYAYDGSDWSTIHVVSPDRMAVWNGLLVLSYPSYGLYTYDGRDWEQLLDSDIQDMVAWGDKLVVDNGAGISLFDGTTWRDILPLDPEGMLPVYFD